MKSLLLVPTLLAGLAHSSILARTTKDSQLDWAPCKIDLGDEVYGNMTETTSWLTV